MRKPILSLVLILVLVLAGWVVAAFWRQQQIHSELAAKPNPRFSGCEFRVPIFRLLENPFRDEVMVGVYQGKTVIALLDYRRSARQPADYEAVSPSEAKKVTSTFFSSRFPTSPIC